MSEKTRILLVCSTGMSTSLLVQSMKQAAVSEKKPVEVFFTGVTSLQADVRTADVILVGPQIHHRLDEIRDVGEKWGVPVSLIPQKIFGMLDGPGALNYALRMKENKKPD